jgi:hypothetical protein
MYHLATLILHRLSTAVKFHRTDNVFYEANFKTKVTRPILDRVSIKAGFENAQIFWFMTS